MEITKDLVVKVLETVDAGLSYGMGEPVPGRMCVEAAVNYAMGAPHGDKPACVAPVLRRLKIALNDKNWSSPQTRAEGLRRLAIAQLGSAGVLDEKEFIRRVAEMTIRKIVSRALLAAAGMKKNAAHAEKLKAAAEKCAALGTCEAALEAKEAAAYAVDADAAAAAYAAAYADAAAAAYAADADAAYAAAYAADADAAAAAYAADAAYAAYAADAADAAADAAAYAADAADAAYAADAKSKARDEILTFFAEEVVQILIAMKVPGAEWLSLTEAAT